MSQLCTECGSWWSPETRRPGAEPDTKCSECETMFVRASGGRPRMTCSHDCYKVRNKRIKREILEEARRSATSLMTDEAVRKRLVP